MYIYKVELKFDEFVRDENYDQLGFVTNLGFDYVLVNRSPNGQIVTIWLCLMNNWSQLWLWIWGWVCCLIGPIGLDMSLASLGSCNLSCVGLIGARLIGHETRHIMVQLWWRNHAQKTTIEWPKNWPNPGNIHTALEVDQMNSVCSFGYNSM